MRQGLVMRCAHRGLLGKRLDNVKEKLFTNLLAFSFHQSWNHSAWTQTVVSRISLLRHYFQKPFVGTFRCLDSFKCLVRLKVGQGENYFIKPAFSTR